MRPVFWAVWARRDEIQSKRRTGNSATVQMVFDSKVGSSETGDVCGTCHKWTEDLDDFMETFFFIF